MIYIKYTEVALNSSKQSRSGHSQQHTTKDLEHSICEVLAKRYAYYDSCNCTMQQTTIGRLCTVGYKYTPSRQSPSRTTAYM